MDVTIKTIYYFFCSILFTLSLKMAIPRTIIINVIFILILFNLNQTMCHTKGKKPRRSASNHLTTNMTRSQLSEKQFMMWVKFVGRLKHSVFRTAKNKLFPSYTLRVAKNPSNGDFTSIQDAIDSLPFINLVRVVIKVHAGVYK